MSTEQIVATKVPALSADAVTKEKAGTFNVNQVMAMGWSAGAATIIAASADNVAGLMASGVPWLAAVRINADISA